MSRKDIYREAKCEACQRYVYEDLMRRDAAGRLLCDDCHVRQLFPRRKRRGTIDIPIPIGAPLLQLLAVVLILGLLSSMVFRSVAPLREQAQESELELIFLTSRNTEEGRVAAQAIAVLQEKGSLEKIALFAGVEPEALEPLQKELQAALALESPQLQVGAAIKAIQDWQKEMKKDPP